ncbi:MAG: twitching motility protein PilT [Lachnospiraceae bacterium]|nr:twitching motility protein PilT [Lachnospiraceae bacterium]
MIQLILGNKGKGKTKVLLDRANTEIKTAHGSIVYLDKNAKHMYELNNRVRLIDMSGFDLKSSEEFIGFIYGIISQDHDLEQLYLDSFLTIAKADSPAAANTILDSLHGIGEKFHLSFIISISLQADDIDPKFKENIITEL